MPTEILLTIKLNQKLFADPKRIKLLKAIDECGSISQAAKLAKVSYKSAWDHLEAMNALSPKPLLARNTGGKNGGGTQLTPYAERLLQLYYLLEQTQQKAFAILQDENIPLDSLLSASAKFAPQSSARNQFFGRVERVKISEKGCEVSVGFADFSGKLTACITPQSAERLHLAVGKEVMLMVKAPWVKVHTAAPDLPNTLMAQVESYTPEKEIALALSERVKCYATSHSESPLTQGQAVWITIDPAQIVLLSL